MKKTLKRFLASLMVAVMVLTAAPLSGFVGFKLNLDWLNFDWIDFSPRASAATSGTCGENLTWTFDEATGELVISGTGEMTSPPRGFSYGSVKKLTIRDGVTSICENAFSGFMNLASITIPDSVRTIGPNAFFDSAYYNDTKNWVYHVLYIGKHLIRVDNGFSGDYKIKDGTLVIADEAFSLSNFNPISSITIPESVISIGYGAFNAYGLRNIYVDSNNQYYSNNAQGILFNKNKTKLVRFPERNKETSYVIPDSVTCIGVGAFSGCTGLTSITIPDSVTSIGEYAFRGCTGFESMTIPSGVTSIGHNAFRDCNLTSVRIRDISAWCNIDFEYNYANPLCSGADLYLNEKKVTTLVIPDDIINIKDYTFYNCISLVNVTIPDHVTSIGDAAFYKCSGLTELTMPISAKIYNGGYTFGGCTNIEKITLTKGNGTVQNYTWREGDSDTDYQYTPWYSSGCSEIVIEDGITSIGSYTFYNCTGLTSITIPDSVTSIGEYAFDKCTALENVYFGGDVTDWCSISFEDYASAPMCYAENLYFKGEIVTELIIPDSVTNIGSYTFYGCEGLTSITIPDSVTSIDDHAFFGCTGLTELTMPISAKIYGNSFLNCTNIEKVTLTKGNGTVQNYDTSPSILSSSTYYQYTPWYTSQCSEVVIEDGITNIGTYTFYDCEGLPSITIPDSVTSIGKGAFCDCTGLTSITIPDSVTSIGSYAFQGCTGLTELTMPISAKIYSFPFRNCTNIEKVTLTKGNGTVQNYDTSTSSSSSSTNYQYTPWYSSQCSEVVIEDGITSIGSYTFYDCEGLTSITIPDSVISIGYYTFCRCTGLTSVTIPDSVTSIDDHAFFGCTGLTSITISNSVESIGNFAFSGCTGLTSITIPDGVTSIGDYAFYNCASLISVTIPDSVTSIGDYAFYNCASLTSITIPNSVTSIGNYAFSGCTGINSVRIPGSVTKLGSYSFRGCTGLYSVTLCTGVENTSSAFSGCTSIDTFTISSTVTSFRPGSSNPTYIYYGGSEQEWKEAKFSLPENENRVIYYNSDIPPSSDRISFSKDVYPCFVGESFYISGELVSTKQVGDITLTWTSGDGVELHTPASVINSSRYKASFSVEAKGVEPGYYTVTVKGSNGKSDSCTVRVVEPKSELSVSVTDVVEGGYYCINNTLVDHNLNELDSVSYKIIVENKLSIDSTGVPLTEEIKEQLTIENISVKSELNDYSNLAVDIAALTELSSIGSLAPGEKKVVNFNITPHKLDGKNISAVLTTVATAADQDSIKIETPISIKNKLYEPYVVASFYVDSEVIYNDGKYDTSSIPVQLRITNRIPSDFKGSLSKIKDLPEYQIKINGASVVALESDLIKKLNINQTLTKDTLKPGETVELSGNIDINTRYKISKLIEAEYVGFVYEVQTSANNLSGNKVVTFVNKDYEESSDELSKKAQEELEKLKKKGLAGVVFDPFIMNYLNKEELKQLEDLLLTQIILQTLPEDSLEEKVKNKLEDIATDDIMDAIESVDEEVAKYVNTLKGIQEITPSVTKETIKSKITIQTADGPVTIYFDGTLDKYDYNDRNFANITNSINYRIEGDHIPKNAAGTSGTVAATLAKVDEFSKAAEDVAVDAIIDACTEAYGPAVNKAQDVLFGQTADKIANKAAKIAWVIATSPSKVVSADCPVDIFVYDENGNLCASVESDVVTRSCEKAAFEISASKKSVRLFDEGYTVKFIPTGNATMNVTVEEYANSFSVLKTYEFTDVPISYGGVYTQSVNTEYMSKDNSYELTLEDGTVVEPDTVIDNFHYHTVEKYETVTEATCSSAEVVCGECTVCQNLVYDTIGEPVDCTPGEWIVVKEATCAQVGEKQIKCVYCDDVLETEEISLLPHTEGEWIITVQPTQTLEGKKEQKCTVCGKTLKQESVDKLPSGKVRSVSIENFTMEYKDSATITPNIEVDAGVGYTVSYNSSDSSVIQIDENGNITTRDKGSATITVTVTDEHGNTVTDTCEVTVKYKWWQWIIVIVLFGWIWY